MVPHLAWRGGASTTIAAAIGIMKKMSVLLLARQYFFNLILCLTSVFSISQGLVAQ